MSEFACLARDHEAAEGAINTRGKQEARKKSSNSKSTRKSGSLSNGQKMKSVRENGIQSARAPFQAATASAARKLRKPSTRIWYTSSTGFTMVATLGALLRNWCQRCPRHVRLANTHSRRTLLRHPGCVLFDVRDQLFKLGEEAQRERTVLYQRAVQELSV